MECKGLYFALQSDKIAQQMMVWFSWIIYKKREDFRFSQCRKGKYVYLIKHPRLWVFHTFGILRISSSDYTVIATFHICPVVPSIFWKILTFMDSK